MQRKNKTKYNNKNKIMKLEKQIKIPIDFVRAWNHHRLVN